MDSIDEEAFEGWIPTPPRQVDEDDVDVSASQVLDPVLKDVQVSPSDTSLEAITHSASHQQSMTPSSSQSPCKRARNSSKSERLSSGHLFEDATQSSHQDLLGLKSLMSQIPTREEHTEAQNQVVMAQEQMTKTMTDAMTSMITANRAVEIAAKKELALEELQYKNRLARGNMVFELIRAGRTPKEARMIAREEFPDN